MSAEGKGEKKKYGFDYYIKGALAGAICCSITHGALCPVDVVKTRIQLDPTKYNKGMIGGFGQVVSEEGVAALATGLGPTAAGYFLQGFWKFGGVEFFKINIAQRLGEEQAWNLRMPIYLGAAAGAECVADVFLCPLEATRIRLVADPKFANGLMTGLPKIIANEGVMPLYRPMPALLMKQVPYTMAKFAIQGWAEEVICKATGINIKETSSTNKTIIALASGTTAGVGAAIISHPADTLLSMINKSPTAGGTGGTLSRFSNLAKEVGFKKLCLTGLGSRCVMIGTLTAGQFLIFDKVMAATGATKFHFTQPKPKQN